MLIADAFADDDEDVIGDVTTSCRPAAVTAVADHLKGLPSRRPTKKPASAKKPVVASAQGDDSADPPDQSDSTSSMNTYEIRVREEKRRHALRRFR